YIITRCPYTLILFCFHDTAPPDIYTLSLHDALPISESRHPRHQDAAHGRHGAAAPDAAEVRPAGDLPDLEGRRDRRAFRPQDGRSEEHTSELQSQSNLVCRLLLEKKKKKKQTQQ